MVYGSHPEGGAGRLHAGERLMVIRPYGYALWENMQQLLDARFKATGHVRTPTSRC